MKNIKNDIKTGEYKRVYLLYGTENYLKKLYAEKLLKAVVPEDDTMNITKIQGDGFETNEFIGICDTMPFFGDRRVVFVNRSGKFKASKKAADDGGDEKSSGSEKDALVNYIKAIPDTTVVIFLEDEVDKRGKLFKAVKDTGYACEMNALDERDLLLWIGTEFKAMGKSLSANTAAHLIEWVGTDMETLKIEIQKLGFYDMDRDSVVNDDIDAICTRQLNAVIFDLTDAIAAGNMKKALEVYDELNALRQPLQLIWHMLIKHYTQLLVVKELKAKGRGKDEIAGILGAHPYAVQKLMNQVGNLKLCGIRQKLEFGLRLEQDFKNGRISEKNIVELFIMQQ